MSLMYLRLTFICASGYRMDYASALSTIAALIEINEQFAGVTVCSRPCNTNNMFTWMASTNLGKIQKEHCSTQRFSYLFLTHITYNRGDLWVHSFQYFILSSFFFFFLYIYFYYIRAIN